MSQCNDPRLPPAVSRMITPQEAVGTYVFGALRQYLLRSL